MSTHTFLIVAVIVEAVVVLAVAAGWYVARKARRNADACDFPGCIQAREELRALADAHTAIPRQDVLDVVEKVESHEHRVAA